MDKDNDLLRSERFMNVVKALNLSNMELEEKLGINRDLKSENFYRKAKRVYR